MICGHFIASRRTARNNEKTKREKRENAATGLHSTRLTNGRVEQKGGGGCWNRNGNVPRVCVTLGWTRVRKENYLDATTPLQNVSLSQCETVSSVNC